MAQFRIKFYEEAGGYLYFEAMDADEAQEIFDGLESGEIFDDEEEYKFDKNTKHGQTEYSDLEQVG